MYKDHTPPAWLREPVFVVGSHEPLMFRRRTGYASACEEESYAKEHDPALFKRLAEMGFNYVRLHFYKGYGLAAEREEIENTKKQVEYAHANGMKAEVYTQFGSMMYETFFSERPEARQWASIDQDGRPVLLSYGHQPSRYVPCYNNEDWREYMKEVVRVAIEEVKVDVVAWDNYDIAIAPDQCHCDTCAKKFREYLRRKYGAGTPEGDAVLKERFGYADLSHVLPPIFNRFNPIAAVKVIRDPLLQDWVDFICASKAGAMKVFSDYARELKPDVVINVNSTKGAGENNSFWRAVENEWVNKTIDIFSSEEGNNRPRIAPSGALVSPIRTHKIGRATESMSIAWIGPRTSDDALRSEVLRLFESVVFGHGSHCTMFSLLAERKDNIRWRAFDMIQTYKDLYARDKTLSNVGVLHSHPSMTYSLTTPYVATILFEQVLLQHQIPFDILFDSNLDDLSKYDVLVLAGQEALADDVIEKVRRFVEEGGGLVITDGTSFLNEWRRRRAQPGFAEIFAASDSDADLKSGSAGGKVVKADYGKGRAIFVPKVVPVVKPSVQGRGGSYFFNEDEWVLPANHRELAKVVRWAAGDPMPVEVEASEPVLCDLHEFEDDGSILLHLLNYAPDAAGVISAEIRLPQGKKVDKVVWVSFEAKNFAEKKVKHSTAGGRVKVKAELGRYGFFRVMLK